MSTAPLTSHRVTRAAHAARGLLRVAAVLALAVAARDAWPKADLRTSSGSR